MDPEVTEKLPLGALYEHSTKPKTESKKVIISLLPILHKTALRRSSKKS